MAYVDQRHPVQSDVGGMIFLQIYLDSQPDGMKRVFLGNGDRNDRC
jgi:hypothetical protein